MKPTEMTTTAPHCIGETGQRAPGGQREHDCSYSPGPVEDTENVLNITKGRPKLFSARRSRTAQPGQYQVIYADPPWAYRNLKTGGSHRSGSSQHYPTLTPAEVAALPVHTLAAHSATLWLWATVPLLPEILPVMAAWDFTYKTALVWRKTGRKGIGYWFRGEVELLLFGIRGQVPAFRSPWPNIIEARVEGHSRKPACFRQLIERYTPEHARVELFARDLVPGWTCHGFESDGVDVRLVPVQGGQTSAAVREGDDEGRRSDR